MAGDAVDTLAGCAVRALGAQDGHRYEVVRQDLRRPRARGVCASKERVLSNVKMANKLKNWR